jgi:hypothetical protein
MTDLVITPASVIAGSGASIVHGVWGETGTAGQAVYLDATTGKYMRADSNAAAPAARVASAIALNGGGLNQPVSVLTSGPVTIGATLVAGNPYYLSDAPGGICPFADVGAGEFVCLLGLALSTTVLQVQIQAVPVSL